MTDENLRFELFVAGDNELSAAAISNLRQLTANSLGCHIEIIDVLLHPRLAREHRIAATPMLVRLSPGPVVKVLGDLSDHQRVRNAVGLSDGGHHKDQTHA